MDQSLLDKIANSLDIKFDILSNMADGCIIRLTFTNKGRYVIKHEKWTIYFSSLRKFNERTNSKSTLNPNNQFEITHLNGYLHSMEPTRHFADLHPDKAFKFYVRAQGAIVSKTDVMPNWYVAALKLTPRVIRCTEGESLKFVGPFNTPAKWKQSPADSYDPLKPEERYNMNNIADLRRAGNLITPTPLVLNIANPLKTIKLRSRDWSIVTKGSLDNEGQYLAGE